MSHRHLVTALALSALTLLVACQGPPPARTDGAGEGAPDGTVVEHSVRAGETLTVLADLYYGDPERAATIAADNGVGVSADLVAGSVLRLRFAEDELDQARKRQTALRPYNRGVAAMGQGDLDEAERQFRLALTTEPDLDVAAYNLALVFMKRGRHEPAADLLAPLVVKRPADADYGFALGNALFYQTRYGEAAAAYGAVLERDPGHRRAAFGHARSLQEDGQVGLARAAWDHYLELDDQSPWADEARRLRRQLQDR